VPLEVREIGINFSVDDDSEAPADEQADRDPDDGLSLSGIERARIVDTCVRAVLEELRRNKER
jgi:hypothetical protein